MSQPISVISKGLVRERQRAGISLAEVARRAGIAKSTLSQLEAGNGNPSLETLWALCVALNIPFARLMEPEINKMQVIRRGEGPTVVAELADYKAVLLATCPPGSRRDIYLLTTQPGADRVDGPVGPHCRREPRRSCRRHASSRASAHRSQAVPRPPGKA